MPFVCTVHEQVRVNGILYGGWGRENYGTKPIKVDALEVRYGCCLIDMLICAVLLSCGKKYRSFSKYVLP